jgi:cytochrome c-type biogenesis protein CcmE
MSFLPSSPRARARLAAVLTVLLGLGLALAFALYGLSGKITYFKTPSDIANGVLSAKQLERALRIGGLVKTGTLIQTGDVFAFTVTDGIADLAVTYRGVMPDLFREGQGVVAFGHYDPLTKIFKAHQILAKHDENYMPPDVKRGLEDAHQQGLKTLMEEP